MKLNFYADMKDSASEHNINDGEIRIGLIPDPKFSCTHWTIIAHELGHAFLRHIGYLPDKPQCMIQEKAAWQWAFDQQTDPIRIADLHHSAKQALKSYGIFGWAPLPADREGNYKGYHPRV